MAPHARRVRVRVFLVALCSTALVTPLAPKGAVAEPRPTIQQVEGQLKALQVQAGQAAERYNGLQVQLNQIERQLAAARARVAGLTPGFERDRVAVTQFAAATYRASGMSPTARAVLASFGAHPVAGVGGGAGSSAASDLINGLTLAGQYSASRQQALRQVMAQRGTIDAARADLDQELAAARAVRDQLGAVKREVEGKLAAAQRLYDGLRADERAKLAAARRAAAARQTQVSRAASRSYTGPASGRAAAAIAFARAQIGDAYVWGAAGPSTWDCSGLTMKAWGAAGVGLPHSSAAQYASGRKVARGDLRPGDLVFFYQPISHVGIYIGNGMMINAPRPGTTVRVDSIDRMPYSGAIRP